MAFGRKAASVFVLLVIFCTGRPILCETAPALAFSEIQKRRLSLPIYSFSGLAVSPSGSVYSAIHDERRVYVLTLPGGRVDNILLRDFPQEGSKWQLGPEVAGDRSGNLYVSGHSRKLSFREEPSNSLLGVLVFRPDGRYSFTMHLTPSIEIKHMLVDDAGNLFVLGIDLNSLYHPLSPCLLVHKYSRQGTRSAAFSFCPAAEEARSVDERPGQLMLRREGTARAGQLFFYDGLLCHVLLSLRIIRMFESGGRLVRELRLEPPSSDVQPIMSNVRDEVAYVVVLQGGSFLVEWAHLEQTEFGPHRVFYLRIHDGAGRALTDTRIAPVPRSMLLYADQSDYIYFLGMPANSHQELIRTRLSMR